MKKVFVLLIINVIFLVSGCAGLFVKAEPEVKLAENPKLACYWTSPIMSIDDARGLAEFHMVIVDMENIVNNWDSLVKLAELNPKIILLIYSNPMELFDPMAANRPLQKQLLKEVNSKYPGWFLKTPDGKPVVFWKGMKMMNLSSACPIINGYRWNQYYARFLLEQVFKREKGRKKIIRGYFMDNSGGNVSWIMNGQIDSDNDGIRDNPAILDQLWSEGIREFLTIIREAKGKEFIMVGNKMTLEYVNILNGKMAEEFPNNYLGDNKNGGWDQTMKNYSEAGLYSIVHAVQIPHYPEHRLFVICSALLGNGYYAYGQNLYKQFPEYRDIGKSLGEAYNAYNGTWMREFEKAIVKVWPEEKKGEIIYK